MCLSLTGCFFSPRNAVQPATLPLQHIRSTDSIIVYGLKRRPDMAKPLTVVIERYDPATREGGNCARYDHAQARVTAGPIGTEYFVFQVPAGSYTFGSFGTGDLADESLPTGFVVPPGSLVYLGDYSLVGDNAKLYIHDREVGFSRDLEAARASLGTAGAALMLAEFVPGSKMAKAFLCTS